MHAYSVTLCLCVFTNSKLSLKWRLFTVFQLEYNIGILMEDTSNQAGSFKGPENQAKLAIQMRKPHRDQNCLWIKGGSYQLKAQGCPSNAHTIKMRLQKHDRFTWFCRLSFHVCTRQMDNISVQGPFSLKPHAVMDKNKTSLDKLTDNCWCCQCQHIS